MPILPPQNRPQSMAGTGFTNLQRYLQANKANILGQAIAGRVQEAGTAARGAITQAGQKFGEQAETERQRLGQVGQQAGQLLQKPEAATEEETQKFQRVLGAESLGPSGVQDAEALRSQAEQAQALGRAGGTQQGRFGLLQRYVGGGRGQYGLGQQRLDQMLLGQTGQQQLRTARGATIGLGQQAQQQIGGAEAQAQELRGQAKQLAESTLGKLGEQATAYDVAMQQKLAEQEAAAQGVLGQLKGTENVPIQLTKEQLRQLSEASGGILKEGATLYGADISPYLQINKLYDIKQAAQSAEDLARAQGLAKLGGQYFAPTEQYKALAPYIQSPELAGKFAAQQFDVTSLADLNKAVEQQRQAYEAATAQERGTIQGIEQRISPLQEQLRSQYGQYLQATASPELRAERGPYDSLANRVELAKALEWAKTAAPSESLKSQLLGVQPISMTPGAQGFSAEQLKDPRVQAYLAQIGSAASAGYGTLQGLQQSLAEHQKYLGTLPTEYKAFRALKALPE